MNNMDSTSLLQLETRSGSFYIINSRFWGSGWEGRGRGGGGAGECRGSVEERWGEIWVWVWGGAGGGGLCA